MKIGILTQPLHNNYGGILQAYALQTILKRMGHEAWIINRDFAEVPLWRRIAAFCKSLVLQYASGNKNSPFFLFFSTEEQKSIINRNTSVFIDNNIQPRTRCLKSNKALLKEIKKQKFDAYIVGSDQVWRPMYSPCLGNYFVDFVDNETNIKRIAYAASFGVDTWEFTKKQTKQCAALVQKFDAVSVREKSAISLCQTFLNKDALHVLDPTLLLDKSDYVKLVLEAKESVSDGDLMAYILDSSTEKTEMINIIAQQLELKSFSAMASKKLTRKTKNNIEECIFPSITKWLRGFMDAKFVVTDSFHGCVFSIIFNKPFIVIGNEKRGMSRFSSLLEMFDLEDLLVCSMEQLTTERMQLPIKWDEVNVSKLDKLRISMQFLQNNLK